MSVSTALQSTAKKEQLDKMLGRDKNKKENMWGKISTEGGGDGAHTHGGGGGVDGGAKAAMFSGVAPEETNAVVENTAPATFKSSPAKMSTPYKMSGHELPGPNQRTPAALKAFGTKDSDMPEKVSTTPGKFAGSSALKFFGGWGGGGGGGLFGSTAKDLIEKLKAKKAAKQANATASAGNAVIGAGAPSGGGDGTHTHA